MVVYYGTSFIREAGAIPLGVTTAYRAGSRYDRSANATMFTKRRPLAIAPN